MNSAPERLQHSAGQPGPHPIHTPEPLTAPCTCHPLPWLSIFLPLPGEVHSAWAQPNQRARVPPSRSSPGAMIGEPHQGSLQAVLAPSGCHQRHVLQCLPRVPADCALWSPAAPLCWPPHLPSCSPAAVSRVPLPASGNGRRRWAPCSAILLPASARAGTWTRTASSCSGELSSSGSLAAGIEASSSRQAGDAGPGPC